MPTASFDRGAAEAFVAAFAIGANAGASAFATALALLIAAPASAAIPGHIRRHEITVVEGRTGEGSASLQLRLRAFDRIFDVDLEPSSLLAPDAETVTIGAEGLRRREKSAQVLYRGRLADDPDSTARLALAGRSAIGSITSGGETWYFEPLRRYQPGAPDDSTLAYRASDLDASALGPLACGAGGAVAATSASSATAATRAHADGPGLVELTLVADAAYFATHDVDSAVSMQAVVDQAAAFYERDLGAMVSVVQTVVYESQVEEPLSDSTDSLALLASLADARQAEAATLAAGDVTHLFTGRDLDRSTIGVAYIGGICDSWYGASLVQDLDADLHVLTLLTGHELGHTLGALHDGEDGSPCQATPFGYVMWPSVEADLHEELSACSRASIDAVLDAATCVSLATPPGCGNGALDDGEECDDGNNDGSDCCRMDCRLDAAGVLCANDGNECTADVCDGAGACQHPARSAACDDGDACTTDGQCTDGVCTSTGELRALVTSRLKARFGDGAADDRLQIRAVLGAALQSPPTADGAVIRLFDEGGALLHESVAAAGLWSDRTGAGRSFSFEGAPIGSSLADAAGTASITMRFKPSTGSAKLRVKIEGADLPLLSGRGTLGVQILVGDAAIGDCGSAVAMTCKASDTALACL